VDGARPAAGLVQIRALPLPRGARSARRSGRNSASACRRTKDIRVWDSTAEIRYLVIPERPSGTDGWSEEQLAELVTRDSMIGTGLALQPSELEAAQ
jgi:hypothetical protein